MHLLLSVTPRVALPEGSARELAPLDAALLAWLALEGPTPRARLAQLLWPDKDAAGARNSLRQRLFQLRKHAGVDLVAGSTTLALADGVTHDLDDADAVLGEAAGEDLAPGEFAQWLAAQRARRRARVRRSLVELSEMAEQAKDWDDALTHARELLALEPLSEDAHRRVMRLNYLAGDRAAALLAFDACERVLKDEVGAKPSAETLALLALVSETAPTALASTALPAPVLRPPRMIGREREWRLARAALAEARVVWIEGEAGLGKSRLLQEVAAGETSVVSSAARPGDEAVPYATLARVLRAIEDAHAGPRTGGALPLAPPSSPSSPASPEARLHALKRSLVAQVHDARTAGVDAVFVDDLHFADRASLDVLAWWLQSDQVLPLRWALAHRPLLGDDPLRAARESLLDAHRLEALVLAPLDLDQVVELVRTLALPGVDEPALARHLHRHTGGNPLFVLETLRQAWSAGDLAGSGSALALPTPTSVARLVERRLAQLSPAALKLARCAAVAASDFSIDLASAVLDTAALDLADAWSELEQAHVLHEGAFAHDLIHEATLASVPQPIARHLHAQIAAYLARQGSEPARLARHWIAAQRWREAALAGLEAAQRAQFSGRIAEAAALLDEAAEGARKARDEALRFQALQQRAVLLSKFEFGEQARSAIDALDAAACNPAQRLHALALRLSLHVMRHENETVVATAPAAWEQARALGDAALEIELARCWAAALGGLRRAAEAVERLQPYAEHIGAVHDIELRFEYWLAFGIALDYAGRLRDALGAWDEAAAVARAAARSDMAWQAAANRAATMGKMGRVQEAAEAGQQALREARSRGEVPLSRLALTESTVAHRLRDAGRYAEALELLRHASQAWADAPNHNEQAWNEHRLAVLFQQLGQPERAQRLLAADRPGLHPGLATMRLVHRADVARQLGGEGVDTLRAALTVIPDANDIYHRIATLYATRLVPPDEGEALAASLAVWASARERFGVALSGHVRAAACGLRLGAASRALPHVEAAQKLARDYQPETFYLPELWLVAARVHEALGQEDAARAAAQTGRDWVLRTHEQQVPREFQSSFLERNEVNRELLASAARATARLTAR